MEVFYKANMYNSEFAKYHGVYFDILRSRGLTGLEKDMPLWKLKLSDLEYEGLKQALISNDYQLNKYGEEAALCYAEWWKRDYKGNIPSKEDVATGIGLSYIYGEDLYMAARSALKKHGYTFIHSLKGTEYFRTLLNQGGLPVNYIKKNDSNISTFSRFLKGLVRELTSINIDWSSTDHTIIQQFSCISYLGKSFKNENIYDVSMQIAHAIIMDDNTLLPYDDTDASLAELTKSLKKEYTRAQRERRIRPLSLNWKLRTNDDGHGYLFVNMDVVKDISSDSIPGLNINTCYAFDVFVAGQLVGKYVRKEINHDEDGNVTNATYTRISVGVSKDILWKGEPVIEVKVRCDNDDRLFLTIAGCYPPNFEYPQVFQMLDENLYCKSETANAENNIAIFYGTWKCDASGAIQINDQILCYTKFSDTLYLENEDSGEELNLTNEFTPYSAEFSGNYIPWVEKSNYKILTTVPTIRVYDKEKNRVKNIKVKYRTRGNRYGNWHNLNSSCTFPVGLVDIRVEFPDGHNEIETFYAIGELQFDSCNAQAFSTEITCSCNDSMRPEIEQNEHLQIEKISTYTWKISRIADSNICPSVCDFRIYNTGNPTLRLSIAIPYDGIFITDVNGNVIPEGKIISLANLSNFCIISHGSKHRNVNVTYNSERIEDNQSIKHLQSNVIDGLVSLSDYEDLIMRMFNIYGANSFDRSSSVVLNVPGTKVYIRKFVLETTYEQDKILVTDDTEVDTEDFTYDSNLYAFPVDESADAEDMTPIQLVKDLENENTFIFPEDYAYKEVIVFSGPEARRRAIPKHYNLDEIVLDTATRSTKAKEVTCNWSLNLQSSEVMSSPLWRKICKAYEICSLYNLPFTTHGGLRAISKDPKLLAKFVIAMWLNELGEVLTQDIDRFEQEMTIALHWVPTNIWSECIEEFISSVPEPLKPMMYAKMQSLVTLLQDIFNSTISTDTASEFTTFLVSGNIGAAKLFFAKDINNYKMRIHGISDLSKDLPVVKIPLQGHYYRQDSMLPYYKTMIESAMCAAESTCKLNENIDLFYHEHKEIARTINFYRKYFKEIYSDIFLRTVKLITNPQKRI